MSSLAYQSLNANSSLIKGKHVVIVQLVQVEKLNLPPWMK